MFYNHSGQKGGRQHVPVGLCPVYFYDDRWAPAPLFAIAPVPVVKMDLMPYLLEV